MRQIVHHFRSAVGIAFVATGPSKRFQEQDEFFGQHDDFRQKTLATSRETMRPPPQNMASVFNVSTFLAFDRLDTA
jgi:hypothetical protein